MLNYEKTECSCGEKARVVKAEGLGYYVHCPHCDKCSQMMNTKDEAIKDFQNAGTPCEIRG